MEIVEDFLPENSYFTKEYEKDKIFLHHTAGNHDPRSTKAWWEHPQNDQRVATAYIIGGKSIRDGNTDWDGKILQVMPENAWAYHLGIGGANDIDKTSVAIEICNVGFVHQLPSGYYSRVVEQYVPEEDVVELSTPFRNYTYYHKYTPAQLDALEELIRKISDNHGIDLNKGLKAWIPKEELSQPEDMELKAYQVWLNDNGFVGKDGKRLVEDGVLGPQTIWASKSVGKNAFAYNTQCYSGHPGLWTHTNVRDRWQDLQFEKYDCSPQTELKDMIMRL